MIVNRKLPPKVNLLKGFDFLEAQTISLDNDTLFHFINQEEQDIIRIQFVFDAGTVLQDTPLIASSVSNLIVEGTRSYTAKQIAQKIDHFGAFIDTECNSDTAILTIHCLTNYLEDILPVIKEILESANFPEQEINNYLKIKEQRFLVNNEKVSFLAKNKFLSFLLGNSNPYNNEIKIEDFKTLNRLKIIEFYERFYLKGKFEIYAAGKVQKDTIGLINSFFGIDKRGREKIAFPSCDLKESNGGTLKIIQKNALQTAIRIGTQVILKNHSDFPDLFFANTVLGGYFGSRLMTNIREEKGYTYGIGSGIISLKNISYFVISTEVGQGVTTQTIDEIESEINYMATGLISDKELLLVKNYLKGSILRSFDGAFLALDRFRSIQTIGLDYNYYKNLIQSIDEVDASRIRDVAHKYLPFSSMKKVLVGNI